MLRRLILLSTVFAAITSVTACQSPARTQEAPVAPTTLVVAPTLAPTSTAEAVELAGTVAPEQEFTAVTDWSQVAGQEGDLYVLGNPDAPVRIVDYSDFL
jgi:protein-disulfide isomerase